MKSVVFINPGHDTAGAGYALKVAFEKAGWNARAICRSETYLNYPVDIVWRPGHRRTAERVAAIVANADVIHAMNGPKALQWFPPGPSQKGVVHHLGTTYRREPKVVSAICREIGAVEVTDSIDLLYPGVGWYPIPADLAHLAKLRQTYQPSPSVKIAHAPTDREYKNSDAIIRAVQSLSKRYPIQFDLIERASNAECLRRKAQADIFVDQLTYGFGLNAIEAWGMGIPVVSGLAFPHGMAKAVEMWGELPWANATEDTVEAEIERLIVDRQWREELGDRGWQHAERWHSQESVVRQALEFYQ